MIVTLLPDWVTLPFQSWVIVCPLAKLNFKLQLLRAVELVLVMLMVAVKPGFHWFETA